MLPVDEYRRRVEHNNEVVSVAKQRGKKTTWLFDKVYTWDTTPEDAERHSVQLMRKVDDIYPSLMLEQLAIMDGTGADAFRLEDDGTYTHVEYKHCLFHPNMIDVGPKGGLRYSHSGDSKPTGITSKISAVYNIHTEENLATKARDTYFLLTDTSAPEWNLVDVRMLTSEKIVPILEVKTGVNRSVSLAQFLNYGENVTVNVNYDCEGWNNFADRMRQRS